MPLIRSLAAAAAIAATTLAAPAQAATWDWHYAAAGIAAGGTFTTVDTPDADGFYEITGIAGSRNGVAITALAPAGSAIPGNEPYAVDNLVSPAGARLTWNGFGYELADGTWANPFSDGSTAWEYLSAPPYPQGAGQEVAVAFSAAPVPEPATGVLALLGLAGVARPVARDGRAAPDPAGTRSGGRRSAGRRSGIPPARPGRRAADGPASPTGTPGRDGDVEHRHEFLY